MVLNYGATVHVEFDARVEFDDGVKWIDVQDENGKVFRLPRANVEHINPHNWPPQPGDVWRYLNITLIVEGHDDFVIMVPDNGTDAVAVEKALLRWPGLYLVHRPTEQQLEDNGDIAFLFELMDK